MDLLKYLSRFEFDGKGAATILGYTVEFVKFCFLNNVDSEEIIAQLFTLTLNGCVKQLCYYLLTTSITYFEHLFNELCRNFDKYEYRDVIDEIGQVGMELNES